MPAEHNGGQLTGAALVLGVLLALGMGAAGYFVGTSFVEARALERSVEVKGLAEREVPADTAIWPVQFVVADNQLEPLLAALEIQGQQVLQFLTAQGFQAEQLTVGAPNITDKQAQSYGDANVRFRYSASQTVTVFTPDIERVRAAEQELLQLGKAGIVLAQNNYELRPQYLFNGLNAIKPAMIEEATRNAREVALKFAEDASSQLGTIKSARQGQFTITDRDSNNPHIKRVRIVSTLEYYLVD